MVWYITVYFYICIEILKVIMAYKRDKLRKIDEGGCKRKRDKLRKIDEAEEETEKERN